MTRRAISGRPWIAAKSDAAHALLVGAWFQRKVSKSYLALVEGVPGVRRERGRGRGAAAAAGAGATKSAARAGAAAVAAASEDRRMLEEGVTHTSGVTPRFAALGAAGAVAAMQSMQAARMGAGDASMAGRRSALVVGWAAQDERVGAWGACMAGTGAGAADAAAADAPSGAR